MTTQKKLKKWYLNSWEAISGCVIIVEGGPEEQNHIIETLLGLEDPEMIETELLLRRNGEMQMLKNNEVALSGSWHNPAQNMLTLKANDQFWNFEMVNQNKDSIVLRTKHYQDIQQVEIVLKSR